MRNDAIDHGREFDWGKVSLDYGRYRDIYPPVFYQKIADLGLCISGQDVLDLGTGTGVLPRHMSAYGAHFTGVDISENQIAEAGDCPGKPACPSGIWFRQLRTSPSRTNPLMSSPLVNALCISIGL